MAGRSRPWAPALSRRHAAILQLPCAPTPAGIPETGRAVPWDGTGEGKARHVSQGSGTVDSCSIVTPMVEIRPPDPADEAAGVGMMGKQPDSARRDAG